MKKIFSILIAGSLLLFLLPSLIAVLPLLVLLAFLFGISSVKGVGRSFFGGSTSLIKSLFEGLAEIFKFSWKAVSWLLTDSSKTNRFMGWVDQQKLFGIHQKGFLIDGYSKRMSESASYESLLVSAGMGRGKSSTFVMPNLLKLPTQKPSLVITDTSGEVYENTAGYLASQGYQIKTLNLLELSRSETYNPLAQAKSAKDVAELAKILVSTANQKQGHKAGGDPFWEQSAEKLLRILAQCLQNQPDPQYRNLANLRHLVTSFDAHTAPKGQLGKIDNFVLSATQNDPSTFASYQAFVKGNLKTIQSVLMSADVALDPIAVPEIASVTASNSIEFSELRKKPTALYILVNQTQLPFFSFLLNVFYTDLFKSLLINHENPGRPVWLFLEEFGHLHVRNFEIYATTARKYKVGFVMFLQSLAQLEARYGALNTKTILDGIGAEIYLPGMALDTARNIEARLGRLKDKPLMPANEIIRMKADEALLLQSNYLPVKLKTRRYFEQSLLKRRSAVPVPKIQSVPRLSPPLIQL